MSASTTQRRAILSAGVYAAAASLAACVAPGSSPAPSAQKQSTAHPNASDAWMCATCGVQFAPGDRPAGCPICNDERQYVNDKGQQWIAMEALAKTSSNELVQEEEHLWSLRTRPDFGIAQRAFLVQTPKGNVLWDALSLVDSETVDAIRRLGGLTAIAISHPHFYAAMVDWSAAFGGVPIYLHEADAAWIQRRDSHIELWKGSEKTLLGSLTLVHLGGHFDGSQVLLWPAGSAGRGALLSGDEPFVSRDRKSVTFMRSFPNYIPLGASHVKRIAARLEALPFDRLYGAFPKQVLASDAKLVVARSAERYLHWTGA